MQPPSLVIGPGRTTHTYFTNRKHVDPLHFTVAVDPGGLIELRG